MRIFSVTRLFSPQFPPELATDIPFIDTYLQQIEQELPGRKALRCQMLEEVRDHLLEHHSQIVASGESSDLAAEQVTTQFGDPIQYGRTLRREKFIKFAKIFSISTLAFIAITLLIGWANPPAANYEGITPDFWTRQLVPMLNAPLFAFLMSYTMTFVAVKAKPDVRDDLCVYMDRKKEICRNLRSPLHVLSRGDWVSRSFQHWHAPQFPPTRSDCFRQRFPANRLLVTRHLEQLRSQRRHTHCENGLS